MRCKGCGGDMEPNDVCWRCPPVASRKAPPPPPKPPKPVCTPEENAAGLAALRAAIYAKPGPMAKIVEAVCRRMNGEEEGAF